MTTPTPEAAGVVIIDKPEGLTSHDVVARLRRIIGTRRVGHAGTLDPMATGVLVAAYGCGTRLLPYLQATTKRYQATLRLGYGTSTDDRTGEPIAPAVQVAADQTAIDAALDRFTGRILQKPSSVSAVKVDGVRAYARVRRGEDVDLPARPVTISHLARLGPLRSNDLGGIDVDIDVACTSGTYIRALARDVGQDLGCGGHLTALRRTAVGPFGIADAVPLPRPEDPAPPRVSLAAAASAVLASTTLDDGDAARVRWGQRIPSTDLRPGPVALLSEQGRLLAVARTVDGRYHYDAVFPADG